MAKERKTKEQRKSARKQVWLDFKNFISKGNAIDLAIGVIIGGAFTAIVTALNTSILTPIINAVMRYIGLNEALQAAKIVLYKVTMLNDEGVEVINWANSVYIDIGVLVTAIVNFFVTSLILFAIVKGIAAAEKKGRELEEKAKEDYYKKHPSKRPAPVDPGVPEPTDHELLKEIVQLMKEEKKK